jgi:hypothetical protein
MTMPAEPRYPRNPGFVGSKPESAAPRISEAAPVQETKRPQKQRVMKERAAPVLFEFKAVGDLLEGELFAVDKIKIKDRDTGQPKIVMQYTFITEGDVVMKCLGTYDLNTKLRPSDVGLFVEICFKDVDVSKNNMRIFTVKIEEKRSANFADGTQITDEDIPDFLK